MRTQITNTLYGHYIGMFHPCIQAALSKKLDRWGRRFQEKVSSQFSEQRIKASSSVEINQNDEIDSALILKCEYEGKLEIKVTVENGAVNHFLLEEL